MAERVAKIKRITAGVVFVDQIPRNPVSPSCPFTLKHKTFYWHLSTEVVLESFADLRNQCAVRQNPPQSPGGAIREEGRTSWAEALSKALCGAGGGTGGVARFVER